MNRLETLLRRASGEKDDDDDLGLIKFPPDVAVELSDGTFRPTMKLSDGCEIKIW